MPDIIGTDKVAETKIVPIPQIVIELKQGLTAERADIVIHYSDIPGGWPGVVQMLVAAMGPALQKAFAQLQQPQNKQHIVVVPGGSSRSVH